MENIKIDNIIRTKRRTIALVVTQDARLIVRAPIKTPESYIIDVVKQKERWVRKKIMEISSKPSLPDKEFVDGEFFLFLGRSYPLRIKTNTPQPVILRDGIEVNIAEPSIIRETLIKWYKDEARKKIADRCEWISNITGYKPVSVKISNAKKRWGSCSHMGNLNLSWHLILAPMEIIDYVIVHELVHLEVKNHSKYFWNKVRTVMPDYNDRRHWLKQNGRDLLI
jgi:predicted metal-dependent hydrolase